MSNFLFLKLLGGNFVLCIVVGLILGIGLVFINFEWVKDVGVLG